MKNSERDYEDDELEVTSDMQGGRRTKRRVITLALVGFLILLSFAFIAFLYQEYNQGDAEVRTTINSDTGEVTNPYQDIYSYLATVEQVTETPETDDLTLLIGQVMSDNKLTNDEYAFVKKSFEDRLTQIAKVGLINKIAQPSIDR